MSRKQKALVWFVVGLFAFLLLKSWYSEFAKLPSGSSADASAMIVALLNGGIDVLNVTLSPMVLLMGVPLFLILFTLFKRPKLGGGFHGQTPSPNEVEKVKEELRSGNREAAVQRIAGIQEQHRADLLAQGVEIQAMTPEIGRDIEWTDIVRQVFRVLSFDRAGTVIGPGNNAKAISSSKPYGYLLVESPILNHRVRLPIVHRDDFLLAASVFDDPHLLEIVEGEELLVTYAPKHKLSKGLAGMWHALHYVIVPRGTLVRYYEVGNDMHMARPEPEKIFGTLVWDGEIRVGLNPPFQL